MCVQTIFRVHCARGVVLMCTRTTPPRERDRADNEAKAEAVAKKQRQRDREAVRKRLADMERKKHKHVCGWVRTRVGLRVLSVFLFCRCVCLITSVVDA